MHPLVQAVVETSGSAAAALAGHAELAASIERWCADARARWPEIALSDSELARSIGERLRDDPDPVRALDALHPVDIYLAIALERGDPRAIAVFERDYVGQVIRYIARIDRSPAFVDEIRQLLRER